MRRPERGRDRTIAVAATLVIGTACLAIAFRQPRGSGAFYALGLLAAAVWLAGGATAGGVRWGGLGVGSTLGVGAVVGVFAFGVFVVGREVAQHLPGLSGSVDSLLDAADTGPTGLVLAVTTVSAVAEEVFFRGALTSALPPARAAAWSVVVYAAVTAFTGSGALVLAAVVMGVVFALERQATRGVAVGAVTHVVWSALMVLALPR